MSEVLILGVYVTAPGIVSRDKWRKMPAEHKLITFQFQIQASA